MKKTAKRISVFLLCGTIALTSIACSPTKEAKEPPRVIYKFAASTEGWSGDFADLPVEYDEKTFELELKQSDIPIEGGKDTGILLKGHNRSDDLFMYITKKFGEDGRLESDTTYKVNLSFDVATNVPAGMGGIGGSPGQSVFVKAGVVNVEPKPEEKDNDYRMNIDKGNQSTGGKDMVVLGNIEKVDSSDESYQLKAFEKSFEVKTSQNGEAWVVIGTDSGFEGLTEIYITNVKVEFEEVTE